MALRDPRHAAVAERRLDAVDAEIAQEMASSLQRASGRLDAALSALAACGAPATPAAAAERDALVAAAGEAVWYYVVQREACGMRDSEAVLRELGVPREVQLRMGVRRRAAQVR